MKNYYGTLEGVPRDYLRNEYGDKFTNILKDYNFYMRPPVIPSNYRTNTEYPIYKNCYFDKIKNGESKENVLQGLYLILRTTFFIHLTRIKYLSW